MEYRWLGMRVLTLEEVNALYQKGKLDGCYKLYPDGTETEIDGITLQEIADQYNNGGGFGEKLPMIELMLPDGKRIKAPVEIDISAVDTLDELEYSLWHTIEEYLALFGIRTEDDTPDWATVKTVQESILTVLMDAGVNFKVLTDKQQEEIEKQLNGKESVETMKVEMEVVLSTEDIDDIMCGALEGGITYWCNNAEVVGEYLGEYGHEQIARGGTLKLHDWEEHKDYELTKEKFLEGAVLWVKNPVGCNCLEQVDGKLHFDTCNADAVVCDAIIQYAIFGDVIYG